MKSVICSSSVAPPAPRDSASRALRWESAAIWRAPSSTVLAHVGQLPMALVAALRLPQGVLGPGHVEDVVDDLEQDAQLGREGTEVRQSSGGPPAPLVRSSTHSTDAAISRPVLSSCRRRRLDLAVGHEAADVDVLAADHPVDAGGGGELGGGREQLRRLGLLLRAAGGGTPRRRGRRRRGSRRPRRT